MILLSQVSPGMNLSGRYLYFSKLVVNSDKLCPSFILGTYPVDAATDTVQLQVTAGEDEARILQIKFHEADPWTSICNSNFGWQGIYKYIRAVVLPDTLDAVSAQPSIFSWLPYADYISVLSNEIDRPMLHYVDIDPNKEAPLAYEKLLSDIKLGDDLTDKVIMFDSSVEFGEIAGDAVTIGDPLGFLAPLSYEPNNATWYIKYSLCNVEPDKHDVITVGTRGNAAETIYIDGLWIRNSLDLSPKETYEKFIVTQMPSVLPEYLRSAFVCAKLPVMTSSSVLAIIQESARRMHIPEPASIEVIPTDLTTSDAQNSMLLLTSFNQTLKSISIFANWPQMLKEIRFMAVRDSEHYYNETLRGFDLDKICPSYDGIVSPFIYATDLRLAIPQIFEKEYYDITLGNTRDAKPDQLSYRIVANHICFSSDVNSIVTFLYKTKYAVKSITGELKETGTEDKDICIFDPELCILGTIVSFKTSIGQDPALENALFDRYMEHLKSIVGMPSSIPVNYQRG